MSYLDEHTQEQVKQALADMARPVRLTLFVRQQGCMLCSETQGLLQEVAALSPHLELQVFDMDQDSAQASALAAELAPGLAIQARDEDGEWVDYGVRFYGIPSGYEFSSLITSIGLVSRGDSQLSQSTHEFLRELAEEVQLEVFVTPTCPYCPRAVILAHQLAIASPRVRAAMVEATEFPELSMRYGISGVPHSVINGRVHVVGAVPEGQLAAEIERAIMVS